MGVARLIGFLMMDPVHGDPKNRPAFEAQRSAKGKEIFKPDRAFVSPVGMQPMVSHADTEAGGDPIKEHGSPKPGPAEHEQPRDGADVKAVVAIHSDLKTKAPAKPGDIKAALLVIHGTPDPVVPKADRDAFEAEMDAAGAKWQMLLFSGIFHAYTDEDSNMAGVAVYDEPAARQTYALTHAFIADAFAGRL